MTRPGGGDLQADPVTGEMKVEEMLLVVGYVEWLLFSGRCQQRRTGSNPLPPFESVTPASALQAKADIATTIGYQRHHFWCSRPAESAVLRKGGIA